VVTVQLSVSQPQHATLAAVLLDFIHGQALPARMSVRAAAASRQAAAAAQLDTVILAALADR
jgi:hypothetical protein